MYLCFGLFILAGPNRHVRRNSSSSLTTIISAGNGNDEQCRYNTGGKRHFAQLRGYSLHHAAGPFHPAEGDGAKQLGDDRRFAIHLSFDDACGSRCAHQRLSGYTRGSCERYGRLSHRLVLSSKQLPGTIGVVKSYECYTGHFYFYPA